MKKGQFGRSMVEMLGVLAIIGVLSIGGLYGFSMTMTRHKTNQLIEDVDYMNSVFEVVNIEGKSILKEKFNPRLLDI